MTYSIIPSDNDMPLSPPGGPERSISTNVNTGPTEEARSLASSLGDFCARIANEYFQIQEESWQMDVPLPDMEAAQIRPQFAEQVLSVIRNPQTTQFIQALSGTTNLFRSQDGALTSRIIRAIHGGIQLDILAEAGDADPNEFDYWTTYVYDTKVSIPQHAIGFWTGVLAPIVNQLSTLAHAVDTVDNFIIEETQEMRNLMEENTRRQHMAEQAGTLIDDQLRRAEEAMSRLRRLSPGFNPGGILQQDAMRTISRMAQANIDVSHMVEQVLNALGQEQILEDLGAASAASTHVAIEGSMRTSQLQAIQSHTRQLWVDLWMGVTNLCVGVATGSRATQQRLPVDTGANHTRLTASPHQTMGSLPILDGDTHE